MQLGKLIQENGVSRILRASWKRLSKAITDPMLDELRLRRVDAHAPIAIDGVQSRQRDGTEASVAALLAICQDAASQERERREGRQKAVCIARAARVRAPFADASIATWQNFDPRGACSG